MLKSIDMKDDRRHRCDWNGFRCGGVVVSIELALIDFLCNFIDEIEEHCYVTFSKVYVGGWDLAEMLVYVGGCYVTLLVYSSVRNKGLIIWERKRERQRERRKMLGRLGLGKNEFYVLLGVVRFRFLFMGWASKPKWTYLNLFLDAKRFKN
jgi:hypothetical protein